MNIKEKNAGTVLIDKLKKLKENFGLVSLKSGTEVEDMNFAEIEFLHTIAGELSLPLLIKIGGPEARNDMRNLMAIGVEGILAPMIESIYGLEIFIKALSEVHSPQSYKKLWKAINLETITAYNELDNMLLSRAGQELNQITIGRGDLSGSLHLGVDEEEIFRLTKNIVLKAGKKNKVSSVGGGIHPKNAAWIADRINPDRINSRHIVLETSKCSSLDKGFQNALDWEKELYKALAKLFPEKELYYHQRIKLTDKRISLASTSNSALYKKQKDLK